MMDVDISSNRDYPREVFTIRDGDDDQGHHDDDPMKDLGPPTPTVGNDQLHAGTPPHVFISALVMQSPDYQQGPNTHVPTDHRSGYPSQ